MQKITQKTLIKFYAYELVERIVRFDMLVQEIWRTHGKISNPAYAALEEARTELNQNVLKNKSLLHCLFAEETGNKPNSKSQDVTKIFEWGSALLPQLSKASHALCALTQPTTLQEFELYTQEVFKPAGNNGKNHDATKALTKILGELSTVLSKEPVVTETVTLSLQPPQLKGVSFAESSVLQKSNALGWATGLNPFLKQIIQNQSDNFKKILPTIEKLLQKTNNPENSAVDVLTAALGLRLAGPAYYFQTIADGLVQQNPLLLCHVEPVLFFGLNHYNTIEKSLIMTHESVDKTLPLLGLTSTETDWSHELLADIYGEIDKLLSTRFTFSEKSFKTSKKLKERVAEGILLSSSSCYTNQQLQEQLDEIRENDDNYSIYDVLTKTTEFPHTTKEIINAGWLHKIERMSVWLYAVCEESKKEPGEPDGLTRIANILGRQDQLLLKSIDNAEVHRVLAYQL